MLRIGLLTSGGDCQALNATMRGIVKTLMTNSEEPIEIYGFVGRLPGPYLQQVPRHDARRF